DIFDTPFSHVRRLQFAHPWNTVSAAHFMSCFTRSFRYWSERGEMKNLQVKEQALSSTQQPNPTVIFETLNRYQQSMALKGAIDLELFTHIAAGARTPEGIAARCQASERGVRILCDFLTVMKVLTKANGAYA